MDGFVYQVRFEDRSLLWTRWRWRIKRSNRRDEYRVFKPAAMQLHEKSIDNENNTPFFHTLYGQWKNSAERIIPLFSQYSVPSSVHKQPAHEIKYSNTMRFFFIFVISVFILPSFITRSSTGRSYSLWFSTFVAYCSEFNADCVFSILGCKKKQKNDAIRFPEYFYLIRIIYDKFTINVISTFHFGRKNIRPFVEAVCGCKINKTITFGLGEGIFLKYKLHWKSYVTKRRPYFERMKNVFSKVF